MSSVVEQISVLEREQVRLEGLLTDDRNWRALQELRALNGSGPADSLETELRLKRLLAGNPYYAARLKIVEAVTILRRLRDVAGDGDRGESAPSGGNGATVSAPLATSLGVPLFGEAEKPSRPILVYGTDAMEIVPASSVSGPLRHSPAADAPSHSLTAIRNITPEQAAELACLGVTSFAEIANWTAADVKRVSDALGLGRTISKENWIEQAAQLDRRFPSEAPAAKPVVPVAQERQAPAITSSSKPATAPLPPAEAPVLVAVSAEPVVAPPKAEPAPLQAVPPAEPPRTRDTELVTTGPEPVSPKDWLAQRRRAVAQSTRPAQGQAAPEAPAARTHSEALDHEIRYGGGTAFVPPGEAEVTIATVPPGATSPGAGAAASLRSRLRPSAPATPQIDPASHAGYSVDIEEATVQIIERGKDEPGGLRSAIAAAIPDSGRVSRFLSALKGNK